LDPASIEPNPNRHIDDHLVLLGGAEVAITDLIAATLRRVHHEAERVCGDRIGEVVLTHPAAWGPHRRQALLTAAHAAGLPAPVLIAEPVAAAAYLVDVLAAEIPVGQCVVVYDFGAGTFDASVVQRRPGGLVVLAAEGLADVGGLDVDAAIVALLHAANPGWDPGTCRRLAEPATSVDRRATALLWEQAREAKVRLSRATSTFVHVPLLEVDVPLGREQFDDLVRPILDRTVAATLRAVRDARIPPSAISGVFLVGGSSRIPLVATLLHRALHLAPTVLDQPELVVEGALRATPARRPLRPSPPRSLHAPRSIHAPRSRRLPRRSSSSDPPRAPSGRRPRPPAGPSGTRRRGPPQAGGGAWWSAPPAPSCWSPRRPEPAYCCRGSTRGWSPTRRPGVPPTRRPRHPPATRPGHRPPP
jgi:Ethanolamine utilization protein EutJ (predicted chaperonin)